MAFDSLPVELLMLILELLESTTDLYSVISASPAALQVFTAASERVLLAVIRRRMNPRSLQHAVAAISVPSINVNRPERLRLKSLWNFFDCYFSSSLEDSKHILLDANKAKALATLHAQVCRHMRRYADQTCVQLSSLDHEQWLYDSRQHVIDNGQQLSSTELTRLERGFYRFELYCRMFPAEPGNAFQTRSPALEQFERFIKRLEPWEMEEVVCVHQYFVYHLGMIVDDLESKLVTQFLANACRDSPVGDDQQLSCFDDLDMKGMMLFSTEARKDSPPDLEYVAASGLPFMNSVLHAATSTERLDLIRSLSDHSESCHISNVTDPGFGTGGECSTYLIDSEGFDLTYLFPTVTNDTCQGVVKC